MSGELRSISVRLGEARDMAHALHIAERQHARTVFGNFSFSKRKAKTLMHQCLENPGFECGLVAESVNGLVGFAYASAGEFRYSDDVTLATIHAIALDYKKLRPIARLRTFVALLKGVERWSISRNCDAIMLTDGFKSNATSRILKKSFPKTISVGPTYLLRK